MSSPATPSVPVLNTRQRVMQRFYRDAAAMTALIAIALLVLTAVLAPALISMIGHGPNEQFRDIGLSAGGVPLPPGGTFLLGTDVVGRDLLVRLIAGTQVTVVVAMTCAGTALAIGVFIGMLAGYYGGVIDTVLSGFVDLILGLPLLITAVALVSVYGASFAIMMGTIIFFAWGPIARIVRNLVVAARESEYVEAARVLGASDARIMFREILPNIAGQIVIYGSLLIPQIIVVEASLSFLGLGVPPPTATWGGIIAENQQNYAVAWWSILFPSLCLLVATLAFNVLGDGLRDALDPASDRRK